MQRREGQLHLRLDTPQRVPPGSLVPCRPAMGARLTDVMVAFEGSEAFREVVCVLIEELHRDGWHIGGQPFFGPPTLMSALGRARTACGAIDGTPTTREDLAAQAPVRPQ
jgi:4-oxalocrotonate tautomerase